MKKDSENSERIINKKKGKCKEILKKDLRFLTLDNGKKKKNHTWWLFGETEGVFGSFSCKPRNSRALLPESTVVTAIKQRKNNHQSESYKNRTISGKRKSNLLMNLPSLSSGFLLCLLAKKVRGQCNFLAEKWTRQWKTQ